VPPQRLQFKVLDLCISQHAPCQNQAIQGVPRSTTTTTAAAAAAAHGAQQLV
jgi:hypothetical protein